VDKDSFSCLEKYRLSRCDMINKNKISQGNVEINENDIPQEDEKTIEDEISSEKDKSNENANKSLQCNIEDNKQGQFIMPDKWVVQSAMHNAPYLLKGIFLYLQSRSFRNNNNFSKNRFVVSSYHRFILVGPPGSGKTTLAYAIADMLGWKTIFIPASMLLGRYRNETSINIHNFFSQCFSDDKPKVIIIDELHKLFEHYENDHSDDSQTATAFWQALDIIERDNLHAVIIGTANSVKKLPPELKKSFCGKNYYYIITR